MFATRILFGFAAVAFTAVVASPVVVDLTRRTDRVNSPESTTSNSCNVGEAQCCQTIHQTNDRSFRSLSALLGLAIPTDGLLVGLQCSPIAGLLGVAGANACHSTP